jgi:hypothetical protein
MARSRPTRTSNAFPARPRASRAMLQKVPNSVDQLCEAPGRRCSHDSPASTPGQENAVKTHSRTTSGGRRIHDSPTANPGRETQS